MSPRAAAHVLERRRAWLQQRVVDSSRRAEGRDLDRAEIAALDEAIPMLHHEADLMAVDSARLRALYGTHRLPLAAP